MEPTAAVDPQFQQNAFDRPGACTGVPVGSVGARSTCGTGRTGSGPAPALAPAAGSPGAGGLSRQARALAVLDWSNISAMMKGSGAAARARARRSRSGLAARPANGRRPRWLPRQVRRARGRCRSSPRPAHWPSFWGSTWRGLSGWPIARARERAARPEPLRHYRYRWMAKASGSLRLIESPKPRLKQTQRRLLDLVLAHIPPHEAAHGFRAGRSVSTFVAPHAGRSVVLKMDLRDFFPSITAARVVAIFLTAGYPEGVARLLAGLCTNTVPRDVMREVQRVVPDESPEGWRSRTAVRSASFAPGSADVARPGQPLRLPARRPARWSGPCRGGQVLALCRRPGFFGRRSVRPSRAAVSRSRGRHHTRRRLRRSAQEDAGDATGCPPAGRGSCAQPPSQRPAARFRRAQGHSAQLRAPRPERAESRGGCRLPRSSGRPDRVRRQHQPATRRAIEKSLRSNCLVE